MERRDLLLASLREAQRLRATGPATDAFLRWRDDADEMLADLVGAGHRLRLEFREAAGPYGPQDAEGLQVEGPRGLRQRLERGSAGLRRLLAEGA